MNVTKMTFCWRHNTYFSNIRLNKSLSELYKILPAKLVYHENTGESLFSENFSFEHGEPKTSTHTNLSTLYPDWSDVQNDVSLNLFIYYLIHLFIILPIDLFDRLMF